MDAGSHLEHPSVVRLVLLGLSSLRVHLVPLTGSNQIVVLVEQSRIQGVSVYQTHQVLLVVLPGQTNKHTKHGSVRSEPTCLNVIIF